jgi:hypothetical protein
LFDRENLGRVSRSSVIPDGRGLAARRRTPSTPGARLECAMCLEAANRRGRRGLAKGKLSCENGGGVRSAHRRSRGRRCAQKRRLEFLCVSTGYAKSIQQYGKRGVKRWIDVGGVSGVWGRGSIGDKGRWGEWVGDGGGAGRGVRGGGRRGCPWAGRVSGASGRPAPVWERASEYL